MSELSGHSEVKIGSERSFGIVFAAVFLIVALFPLVGEGGMRIWALVVAAAFAVLAVAAPRVLHPLNRVWFLFGLLLNKIVSPIVMGILFFVTVTPTGFVMRALGNDLLKQKLEPNSETYWIPVDPKRRSQSSMKRQF